MAEGIPSTSKEAAESYRCRECLAGRCRKTSRTYFAWVQSELILVQNFPAWVCDYCGWNLLDPRAVLWLRTLINSPQSRKLRARSIPLGDQEGHQGAPRPISK